MTNTPLVSVCVPLYNAAEFLPETIERLLAQTYANLELVIVDNASTDGSAEIAERYARSDARIRIVRNRRNIGFPANFGKAVSLAQGELMMVHCADDIAEPDAIERMVAVFGRPDVDPAGTIVITDAYFMESDGVRTHVLTRDPEGYSNFSVPYDTYRPSPDLDRVKGLTALALAMAQLKTVGWFGAMMYPRALAESVEGVRNGRLHNPDKHYMYKLLSENPEVIWLHQPLFSWRQHDSNQTAVERAQGAIVQSLDDYIYTFEYSAAALQQWQVDRRKMIASFVDRGCLRKALAEIAHGSRLLAMRYLFFALATYPKVTIRNRKFYVAAMGVLTGPLGSWAARLGRERGIWRRSASAPTEPT
jgi:glycosyltransferase involved in cell wall biosynthesis